MQPIKRFTIALSVLAFACSTLLASSASAQVHISPIIGMGVAMPSGRLSATVGTGLTATGGAELSFGAFPVSLLPEFNYTRFTDQYYGRDSHQISGSLNAVVPIRHGRVTPFVTGGVGIHHLARNLRWTVVDPGLYPDLTITKESGDLTHNAVGFNAGGGVEFTLGSVHGRLDARYYHLKSLAAQTTGRRLDSYIPITLSYLFQ
jgi:opacity protein-like surface antigen